ncbi:MAG: hypothetical protein HKN20_13300 [Gemmatimonadetes bacterium]|nr:hypothetical protein [Gemmatimonadota bacterium]
MKWILSLYPAAWQKRYRRELALHLEEEELPVFRTSLDLIAGAIDAWRNPGEIPITAEAGGERNMITAARCGSLEISRDEGMKSAALMLGITFVLTAIGVFLDKTYGDHAMFDALIFSSFFIALSVSARLTYLKPYTARARNVITLLIVPAWYLFFLGVMLLQEII